MDKMMTDDELRDIHAYHPPKSEETKQHHELIRNKTLELALWLNDNLPESVEKWEALRHVRLTMMFGNAAIAIHGEEL